MTQNPQIRFKKDDGSDYPDWVTMSLSEVCDIDKGQQKNKDTLSNMGSYPVINGGVKPSGYSEEFNTNADTITISEGGNSCGFVNYSHTPFWAGGHCYVVSNIRNNVDKKFLFQILKKHESQLMALRVGSGLPNIQKSTIIKYQIPLPCLEEQQKIAEYFTALDNKIANLDAQLSLMKEYKKAMLQRMLG